MHPGRPWDRGTQPSTGAPHGSGGVGWGGVWGSAPQWVLGGQNPGPVQGHSMCLPQAGQLWLGGGAGVLRRGQGGQLCPAHVTRRPTALAWVRGWEQLASGRPLNKEPLSSTHAGSAPSGQRTFPGMPRPAPSVAYRSHMEVEQLALEPADRALCWGSQPPSLGTPGQGQAARTSSRDLSLVACAPGPDGWRGLAPKSTPPPGSPICLVKSCLPQKAQASFSPGSLRGTRSSRSGSPRPHLRVAHVWHPHSRLGGCRAFCPQPQFLLSVGPHPSTPQISVLNSRQL